MSNDVVTIGIDSSTTSCGVALFINGKLDETFTFKFKGTYTLDKLYEIAKRFQNLFREYKPMLVIVEEPIAVRNARTAMALNQVAGAIIAKAWNKDATVVFMHNSTVKKHFSFKTKEEAIAIAQQKFGAREDITDDEADAILIVEAYKEKFVGSEDLPS